MNNWKKLMEEFIKQVDEKDKDKNFWILFSEYLENQNLENQKGHFYG